MFSFTEIIDMVLHSQMMDTIGHIPESWLLAWACDASRPVMGPQNVIDLVLPMEFHDGSSHYFNDIHRGSVTSR